MKGSILRVLYAASEFSTQFASVTGTMFVVSGGNVPLALILGATFAVVDTATTYAFQGHYAKENFDKVCKKENRASSESSDSDEEGELLVRRDVEGAIQGEENILDIPTRTKVIVRLTQSAYAISGSLTMFVNVYFTYMAAKAWLYDLEKEDNEDYRILINSEEWYEILGIVSYFLFANLPFTLTTEIQETCKEIAGKNQFDDVFSQTLKKPFEYAAKVLLLRHYVAAAGTGSHVVEDIVPLIVLIPPALIRSYARRIQQ